METIEQAARNLLNKITAADAPKRRGSFGRFVEDFRASHPGIIPNDVDRRRLEIFIPILQKFLNNTDLNQ